MASKLGALHTPLAAPRLPEGWSWSRLDAVCEGVFDCPHSTPVLTEAGPYVVRSQDIRSGIFRASEAAHVSEETYRKRIARVEPRHGDLLYSREGTYFGIAAEVPESVRLCLGQRMVLLRPQLTAANSRFIRYWLNSPLMASHIHGFRDGSVAERLNMPTIRGLPVALPPLREQRAIARILGTLDDKIELNRRMSGTLEAMARSLFQSWFVDFAPVRKAAPPGLAQPVADLFPDSVAESDLGEIPKGWRVGKLGEVADHRRRGRRPSDIDPSTPYIALEHMPRRCIALSEWGTADTLASNKFAFSQREILFGKLRPYFHKVGVAPVDGVCSTDIVVVAPKHPQWLGFVLGHLSSHAFVEYANAGSTGTKMPRTSWGEMGNYRVVLPPDGVAGAFTAHAQPLVDRIISNILQSRTLIGLRDTLLPQLISGELRVRDAERLARLRETSSLPAQPRQRSARDLQPRSDTPSL